MAQRKATMRGEVNEPGRAPLLLPAYLCAAVFGAGFALLILLRLVHGATLLLPLGPYEMWIVLSGALGAVGALHLCRHRLGHAGPGGWTRALWGILVISLAAPVIAGTLALPLYGTMFGPFAFAVSLVGSPLLAVLWFAHLLASHLLIAAWRRNASARGADAALAVRLHRSAAKADRATHPPGQIGPRSHYSRIQAVGPPSTPDRGSYGWS